MALKLIGTLLPVLLAAFTMTSEGADGPKIPTGGERPEYWNKMAKDTLNKILKMKQNNRIARNVILFVGDGLGITTVTAARILRGQLNNMPGEETVLAFEDFPNIALAKNYNVDRQTPDSASTSTAMLCGVKTNTFVIGLDGTAKVGDCEGSTGKQVSSMLDWARHVGKATGIVTTATVTHATPAGAYAHIPYRFWEGDVDMEGVTGNCKDIARQLVEDNSDINVVLGGGRRYFLPDTVDDPEYGSVQDSQRKDGRHLIEEWEASKTGMGSSKYVWNKDQLDDVDPRYTDYLLGLFEPGQMQYELDRETSGVHGEPSLEEMTRKAIQILRKEPSGFFLMVEARIDHAHHENKAKKALHEALMLEDAIITAMELTDESDTLIILASDHSDVLSFNGYAYRGSDIFGIPDPVEILHLNFALGDGQYSTLTYGNGPGGFQPNVSLENLQDKDYQYPSAFPLYISTHGGEDTAIFARGPMSHLFNGVHEQNYIAHVMAYAACIGPYFGDCDRPEKEECSSAGTMATTSHLPISLTLFFALKQLRIM